ncbi:CoA transferase, partial [Bordetella hinzii]|nr:CoA transferase [Bordetella hinzii]
PQVRHRGLRVDIPRGTGSGGVVSTIASPLRLRDTPPRYDLPPPRLGDSTERVLGSLLGYGPEDIARLRGQGIV